MNPFFAAVRIVARALLRATKDRRTLRQEETCQIVAHRGASLSRHENTVEAFALAANLGADYAELDVRRTGDGVFIAHHDPTVSGKPIASNTLEVLRSAAREGGYQLATLDEVLKFCRGKIKLDVELKEEVHEREVLNLVRSHFGDREFVITSFSDLSLQRVKSEFRDVRCGLLLGRKNPRWRMLTRWSELFPVRRALKIGVDFVAPHHRLLRFAFSKRLRANGIPLWVWTVDDPILIRGLLGNVSVEAIITNAPDVALSERKQMRGGRRS